MISGTLALGHKAVGFHRFQYPLRVDDLWNPLRSVCSICACWSFQYPLRVDDLWNTVRIGGANLDIAFQYPLRVDDLWNGFGPQFFVGYILISVPSAGR